MTQSFATREPDDLDGFEMDDEFLNLAAAETAGADAVPAYPTGPDAEAAFNPVGRLVDAAESAAVTAILPAVATPAPVAPGVVAEPLSHSLEVASLPVAAAALVPETGASASDKFQSASASVADTTIAAASATAIAGVLSIIM